MNERVLAAALRDFAISAIEGDDFEAVEEVTERLNEALLCADRAESLGFANVRSYKEAAVLTDNEGFVVRSADGSEYQVTIVRSK